MYDDELVDQETKAFLEQIAARFDANLNAALGGLRVELKGEIADLRVSVKEQIEASETKIITAFWNWSRPFEARMRRLDASDAVTAERLIGLEERMGAMERRIGFEHGPTH